MHARVCKMGNSAGVIIPKPALIKVGVQVGDNLTVLVDEGRILLAPMKRHPRAGWADASKRVAQANDDALVWPDFSNDDDADLEW
jgi:antitoxin MazE